MAEKSNSSVYIGNLDERVSERVLYDILIQAGRVVDLHIPRDRETNKPKGYAFAEYESEEVANYAVKLFTGLVSLYKRTLRFGISGQDKPSLNLPSTSPSLDSSLKPRQYHGTPNSNRFSSQQSRSSSSSGFSDRRMNRLEESDVSMHEPNVHRSSHHEKADYSYSRRAFGAALDNVGRSRSRHYDTHDSVRYRPY